MQVYSSTIRLIIHSLAVMLALPALCWSDAGPSRHEIPFPDLPGYTTLACDFHTHTVFSDGNVWPPVRVHEAWRQGLDALAITDHIEYQPHKAEVPTQHNRPYELALDAAKARNIILVRGAEITRDTPPGHFNAIFLEDVKPLDTPDFLEVFRQANQQKAFVFWNHHAWKGEEKGKWLDVHTTLYDTKALHGMEIANAGEYYPSAHAWCLEKNLAMLGNSDIHDPDLRLESSSKDHRTMTLVLAKERTAQSLKEALHEGRTIVWYQDKLIGREEYLRPFFHACVQLGKPSVEAQNFRAVQLSNTCQADITLEPKDQALALAVPIVVPSGGAVELRVPASEAAGAIRVEYTVKNFLVGPGQSLSVTLEIPRP